MNKLVIILISAFLFACANPSAKTSAGASIDESLPSFTAAYDAFSCDQLFSEARRITAQMQSIANVRDEDAEMERLEFVGGVLYWPVLFLIDGSSDSKAAQAEYDQLKERLLSVSKWIEEKSCSVEN